MKITILTYCTGYPYEVFERFVGSAYDTGFNGHIIMVVQPCDLPIMKRIKTIYPKVMVIVDESIIQSHLNCHRFFTFENILKQQAFDSTHVFLCDSRDVLFQKNIEDYPFDNTKDLYVFQEGVLFKDEPKFNIPWIKMLESIMKEYYYDVIQDKPVICCGTTLGTIETMKQYVTTMCTILRTYNIRYNLDQGIHNLMVYHNFLNCSIQSLSNTDNVVNTVACDEHLLNDQDQIVNKQGTVSYIVHQYDRFAPELKKRISKKYNFMIH